MKLSLVPYERRRSKISFYLCAFVREYVGSDTMNNREVLLFWANHPGNARERSIYAFFRVVFKKGGVPQEYRVLPVNLIFLRLMEELNPEPFDRRKFWVKMTRRTDGQTENGEII